MTNRDMALKSMLRQLEVILIRLAQIEAELNSDTDLASETELDETMNEIQEMAFAVEQAMMAIKQRHNI